MLDKFGKLLDQYLAQNPQNDQTKEEEEDNEDIVTENNTTKFQKKRALFSQTCNDLLEADEEKSDNDDEVFPATPRVARIGMYKFCQFQFFYSNGAIW